MMSIPDVNLGGILPAVVLGLAGLVVMIVGLYLRKGVVAVSAILSLVGILIAIVANSPLRALNKPAFSGLISLDPYSWFLQPPHSYCSGADGFDFCTLFDG